MKQKKQIQTGNPPKAFVGIALMAATAAMSIANGIKKKKEAKKAARSAENSALSQQLSQDTQEAKDYKEDGMGAVNYYQAGGGKVRSKGKGKTDPTEKELNQKDVKAINKTTGVQFNKNSANALFTRNNTNTSQPEEPSLDYGKYAGVDYFKIAGKKDDTIRVKNTSKNPHNPSTIKPAMNYLRKRNPNKKIALDFAYKAGGGNIKTGGSYDTIGGSLNKVSSDMEVAKGNTHESSKIDNTSGIKLIQGNKAIAEIEDKETIKDGNLVYSDRLKASNGKTFAKNAEVLARKKGKVEKRLNKGDSISKATTERRVGMLDLAENILFAEQEEYKKINNIEQNQKVPKAKHLATGGFAAAAPYIDNAVNAGLSLFMTPKVPKPSYLKNRKLKTKVNVNPQLNSVDNAVAGASKAIMENTSNSNVARNTIASVKLKGAGQKANIFANKENQETQLENADIRNQQHTDMINAGKRDGYNNMNMARQAQIKSELSANMSNLAGDLTDAENNKRDEAYNRDTLAAFKTAYAKNGIVDRSDESMQKWIELMMMKNRANGGTLKRK